MTKELKNQIEGMTEDYCSDFLDVYQCADWGISAREFADILLKKFAVTLAEYAKELDEDEN